MLNMTRCMLFATGLPLYFWGDAVEYATYVLNRSSCSANTKRKSPLEMLTGTVPKLSDVVTFGSPCMAYLDPGKKAWKPRAQVGMIVGKKDETKGYKVYLPKDRIVITTQHIKNVETLDNKQNAQLQAQLERENPDLRCAVEEREKASNRKGMAPQVDVPVPAKSAKSTKSNGKSERRSARKAKIRQKKKAPVKDAAASEGVGGKHFPTNTDNTGPRTRYRGAKHVPVARVHVVVVKDPKSYYDSMKDPRAEQWKQAIREEIEALEQNDT